jgi:predicted nucleic acid-binding protein
MPIIFDSSVYISALRAGDGAGLVLRRWVRETPLWLSSVVLEELYAGAARRDYRIIEKLERDFERTRRVLVPSLGDWAQAGRVLGRLAEKYGYEQIGRARLTNDALIATSAGRAGVAVITINRRDFGRLAEFFPFEWQARSIP